MGFVWYIDSSVLVAIALDDPKISRRARDLILTGTRAASSELAVVECQSGVTAQLAASRTPQHTAPVEQNLNRILASLDLISIHSLVLGHARALVKKHRVSTGLRSLDAIHVASANLLVQSLEGELGVRFMTSDKRQYEAFSAEGLIGELI